MAWWRPEEEPSPQERIGAGTRPGRRRRRAAGYGFPFNAPFAVAGLLFALVFIVPFVWVLLSVDFGGSGAGGGIGSRDGPSLVPAERFEEAWGKVRAEAGPEDSLVVLRVAPERIDAILASPGGERRSVQVWADLSVMGFPAGRGGSERGLSLRRLDPALPERLVRRAAERLGAARDELDYLVLSGVGGGWSIFFDGGRYAIADVDGSNMRVPGQ